MLLSGGLAGMEPNLAGFPLSIAKMEALRTTPKAVV
jgi:hypothetical protein